MITMPSKIYIQAFNAQPCVACGRNTTWRLTDYAGEGGGHCRNGKCDALCARCRKRAQAFLRITGEPQCPTQSILPILGQASAQTRKKERQSVYARSRDRV